MIAGHCTALRPSHTRRKHGKGECGQVSTPHSGRRSEGKHCGHPSAVRCVSGLVQRVLCIGHSAQARDSHHRGQGLRNLLLAPIEEAQGAPKRAPSTLVIGTIYWYNHISLRRGPRAQLHRHPGPGCRADIGAAPGVSAAARPLEGAGARAGLCLPGCAPAARKRGPVLQIRPARRPMRLGLPRRHRRALPRALSR